MHHIGRHLSRADSKYIAGNHSDTGPVHPFLKGSRVNGLQPEMDKNHIYLTSRQTPEDIILELFFYKKTDVSPPF